MAVFVLDSRIAFPPPHLAISEGKLKGLLAVGGDLSPERLLAAYRAGIYPWSDEPTISWWSPDPRGIFPLDQFVIPRRLAQTIRSGHFTVTYDTDFIGVMRGCAAPAFQREQTWISPAFVEAYTRLHRLGHAHSVECRRDGVLVGGIYGVAIGGLFAGESMFYTETNASKVALVALVKHLRERGYTLFDTQMVTPHTASLGAVEIRRHDYLQRLAHAIDRPVQWSLSRGEAFSA